MGRLPRPRAQPIQPLRALASLGTKPYELLLIVSPPA